MVLGMHRSGTSALSGVLCALGAAAPKNLLPANSSNPSGYWESLPLMRAHDELLASAGSSWDDWRRLGSDWYNSPEAHFFHQKIRGIVLDEYEDKPLIVIKDPRICRFLPLFLSILEELAIDPVALFVLRNPLEIAHSLFRRDGISVARSIAMWLRHVLDAERESRGMPRHFVTYANLVKDWRYEIQIATEKIGVTWPADPQSFSSAIDDFIATGLQHEKCGLDDFENHRGIPWLAVETYFALCTLANADGSYAIFNALNDLRAKFDQVSDFFSHILEDQSVLPTGTNPVNGKSRQIVHGKYIARIEKLEKALIDQTQQACDVVIRLTELNEIIQNAGGLSQPASQQVD